MGSIARAVSSVAQPVSGGSTNFPTSGFGSGIGQAFQQLINQGALTPATGLPVTIPTPVTPPVTPTTSMSPIRRFNAVVDPRLSRTMSRPMFKPSRYDGQINQLLERLGIGSYSTGGRVNYQDGGQTKTPPKYIPLNMESVAKEMFGTTNLDNLTYNQRQAIMDYIEDKRSKKAYGGRIGYADGTPAAGLVYRPEYEGPYMGPLIMGGPQRGQYYNEPGTLRSANILPYSGGFPGGPLTPRPGIAPRLETTPQIDSIKEAMMSLPQTRSNPRMSAMRKINQVQDPRMMRLMQMLRRQPAAMGGIMNLKMGGTPVEMDLRAKGGFVPIGKKERADDVPARLSKNEFVFTAKAVRNAGRGDIREGARKMYDLMNKLEAKR